MMINITVILCYSTIRATDQCSSGGRGGSRSGSGSGNGSGTRVTRLDFGSLHANTAVTALTPNNTSVAMRCPTLQRRCLELRNAEIDFLLVSDVTKQTIMRMENQRVRE